MFRSNPADGQQMRNDWSGEVGYEIVPRQALTVSALGRAVPGGQTALKARPPPSTRRHPFVWRKGVLNGYSSTNAGAGAGALPRWHFDMLADAQRSSAYEAAIGRAVESLLKSKKREALYDNFYSAEKGVSGLPCNIRMEGGQSLVIGGSSPCKFEGKGVSDLPL